MWSRTPRSGDSSSAFYVSRVVEALGDEVRDWWQGPCDPRTVTILLA
ncbi:hypothetical protein ACFQX6_49785 [Streptosporangium lutulentum]